MRNFLGGNIESLIVLLVGSEFVELTCEPFVHARNFPHFITLFKLSDFVVIFLIICEPLLLSANESLRFVILAFFRIFVQFAHGYDVFKRFISRENLGIWCQFDGQLVVARLWILVFNCDDWEQFQHCYLS